MDATHHEQQYPDSCIAACMCMIQRWRGQAPTEARFHESQEPRPLETVCELGGVEFTDVEIGDERRMRIELSRGKRIITFVLGAPYIAIVAPKYPALRSRHGPMCEPAKYNGPLHALVLVSCSDSAYHYLDPYLPGSGQPLALTDDYTSE